MKRVRVLILFVLISMLSVVLLNTSVSLGQQGRQNIAVSPSDGACIGETVTISGTGASHNSVQDVEIMHMLPSDQGLSNRFLGRGAPTSDASGSWSLSFTIPPTVISAGATIPTPPDEEYIIRVNFIEAQGGHGVYGSGKLTISECREKLSLINVMVTPKGEKFSGENEEGEFRRRLAETGQFFSDSTRGNLLVQSRTWLTNHGNGYSLPHDDLFYGEGNNWMQYVQDVLAIPEVNAALPASGNYSVIALQPGKDGRRLFQNSGQSTYSASWILLENNKTGIPKDMNIGSFINMPFEQEEPVGAMIHELSHGLGVMRHPDENSGRYAQLPDLYQYAGAPANYTNLSLWKKTASYFPMASANPVLLSGYSQVWLGWLTWQDMPRGSGQITAPYIDGINESITSLPRIVASEKTGNQNRKSYVVVEARGKKGHGEWEAAIPQTGVILYKIRESVGNEYGALEKGWPRTINYYDRLDKKGDVWYNLDDHYYLELQSDPAAGNGHETVAYKDFQPIDIFQGMGVDPSENSTGDTVFGCLMRPSLDGTPVLHDDALPAAPEGQDTKAIVTPDLDLHAYLADGTHIGVNYDTGEYENVVEGAITSGDVCMDSEWIMLPKDKVEGVRFEISSKDTQEFIDQYPEIAANSSQSLGYQIESLAFSPLRNGVQTGQAQEFEISPGNTASMNLNITNSAFDLIPLAEANLQNDRSKSNSVFLLAGVVLLCGAAITSFVIWKKRT